MRSPAGRAQACRNHTFSGVRRKWKIGVPSSTGRSLGRSRLTKIPVGFPPLQVARIADDGVNRSATQIRRSPAGCRDPSGSTIGPGTSALAHPSGEAARTIGQKSTHSSASTAIRETTRTSIPVFER
jgi:hypothetical protein